MFANFLSGFISCNLTICLFFIFLLYVDSKIYSRSRIENRLKKKPKKKNEIKLRKDNYPFQEGEPIDWNDQ